MNGGLVANAALVEAVRDRVPAPGCEVVMCVPYPFLAQVGALLQGSAIGLAAQDLSAHDAGAYTGEVSAAMLRELGCTAVIVGHSERRAYHGESDALVLEKTKRALAHDLRPILCVGESRQEREAGMTERVVLGQIEAVFGGLDDPSARAVIVAYEPIWAIGTGLAASPEAAQQVHGQIRRALQARMGRDAQATPLLYGGSVNAGNAAALFAMPDIDGALVGGASLDAQAFLSICAAGADQ